MNKKIVFFDIDGTLLDFDKKIPKSTKVAVKQLQENGVYVAIATGRSPFMFEKIRKELDISSYVSFNGQFVVFEDEVIYRNPIKKEALHQLYEQAKERNIPLVYMDELTMRGTVEYSKHIEVSLDSFALPHPEQDEWYFQENDVYQTLLYCGQEDEAYFQNDQDIRLIRWHPVCMDVVPAGGSKALGIQHFIEKAGFEMQDVYAFGDGLNDIEMIQCVGTGVVMGNAEEELKPFADLLTSSVEQDGIYKGLVQLGLIKDVLKLVE